MPVYFQTSDSGQLVVHLYFVMFTCMSRITIENKKQLKSMIMSSITSLQLNLLHECKYWHAYSKSTLLQNLGLAKFRMYLLHTHKNH